MKIAKGRYCPSCNSKDVSRSHSRGFVERHVLPMLRVRPYRCVECDNRFYCRAAAKPRVAPKAA